MVGKANVITQKKENSDWMKLSSLLHCIVYKIYLDAITLLDNSQELLLLNDMLSSKYLTVVYITINTIYTQEESKQTVAAKVKDHYWNQDAV